MNKTFLKLASIFVCFLIFVACFYVLFYGFSEEQTQANFIVDTSDVKKSYMIGEDFSFSGIKVYLNERQLSLEFEVKIDYSNFDSSKSGQYKISVSHATYIDEYSVNVYTEQEIINILHNCYLNFDNQLQINNSNNEKIIFNGDRVYKISEKGIETNDNWLFKSGEVWFVNNVVYFKEPNSDQAIKSYMKTEDFMKNLLGVTLYNKELSLAQNFVWNLILTIDEEELQVEPDGNNFKINSINFNIELEVNLQDGKLTKIERKQDNVILEFAYTIEEIPAYPNI